MKRGFTLIELLVVVLIIGILSSVALPQYQKSVDRAKGVEALTAAKAIADAENVYYMGNGVYDPTLGGLDIEIPELKNWNIGSSTAFCSCGTVGGCHLSGCSLALSGDWYNDDTGSGYKTRLGYYLENGQTVCRCCVGEKCQNYFGVKSGEEF